MAKKKINNTLRDQFLFEFGLTKNDIMISHFVEDSYIEKTTSEIFTGDANGNMRIYYPTLDNRLAMHTGKDKKAYSYRTRHAVPFKNKNGDSTKYTTEGKNRIFFPPEMLNAYKEKRKIRVLIVTEGEKKAFVACKNGFDCVGISGIWNFCSEVDDDDFKQKELMPELKEFIKGCDVEIVVLLHDSDALDISPKYFTESTTKTATERPNGFYESTKRFAELIFQEGCKFFHSYINPHLDENKLGLDDLIQKFQFNKASFDGIANLPELVIDFYESIDQVKFSSYFCSTQIQFLKQGFIKGIFKIDDPEDFYKYHKKQFKKHSLKEFRFENRNFEINQVEETIKEVKQNTRDSVWVNEGKYWGFSQNNTVKCISNFTMNVLFLLKSNSNPKRIIEFENVLGQKFIKELTMDDLVGVSAFRKKLIGDGSFIYKGDMFEFLNLQEILFKDEKLATELTSLGWQKNYGFYAFSNGLAYGGRFYPIDEFGVVNYQKEKFYLPAFSNLYSDADEAFENERNFRHIESDVTFKEWSDLFYKTYKNNGAIAICFAISALFRDIIFNEFKEFPLLNCFGTKGSGKSTLAKSLMNFFGIPQTAISLENASSTKKGIYRKFSQYRNALVWLDEYKNSVHPDIIGLCKNLYDGIGYERAQTSQDNRTHSNPVLSSTILSGQDMPTIDPALFTRVILLLFKNNAFNEADRANYTSLKALEKKGITKLTIEILGHRALIADNFMKEFKKWSVKFSDEFKYDDIPDRLWKNSAMMIAPVAILVEHKHIELPFTINELYAKFVDVLTTHKNLLNDNQEINVFWEIIETLYDEGVISVEKGDFRFIEETIAIRFNKFFASYSEKYRKMHGRNGLDKMTLTNYLKNSPMFVEVKDNVRFETSVTSAFIFKYRPLGINLQRIKLEDKIEPGAAEPSVEKIEEGKDIIKDKNGKDLPF